jgi:hypothetical protein
MKIVKQNFEKVMIKNWTSFFDIKETFSFLTTITKEQLNISGKVTSIRVTRFELTIQGIVIWFEYIIQSSTTNVNVTSEFLLKNDQLIHQMTATV